MNIPKKENAEGDAELLKYEEMLHAIKHGENPTKIAAQVRLFLEHNPNLPRATKALIATVVQRRNDAERQMGDHGGAKRMRLDLDQNLQERPWLQLNLDTTNLDPDLDNIPAMLKTRPVDVLKWICLNRQSLGKLERACAPFGRLRSVLLGCLVCVRVKGETLVEEIRDVEERVQIRTAIFERRLFLPQLGYFEFDQISEQSPTEKEIQQWVQRHKQMPKHEFLRKKIAKLKSILGEPIQVKMEEEEGNALEGAASAMVAQWEALEKTKEGAKQEPTNACVTIIKVEPMDI